MVGGELEEDNPPTELLRVCRRADDRLPRPIGARGEDAYRGLQIK